jgi:hypothetical protein
MELIEVLNKSNVIVWSWLLLRHLWSIKTSWITWLVYNILNCLIGLISVYSIVIAVAKVDTVVQWFKSDTSAQYLLLLVQPLIPVHSLTFDLNKFIYWSVV